MVVQVRSWDGKVTKYKGYKYYEVQDKDGHRLFGFHVSSEEGNVDVYFALASVTAEKTKIIVRSAI